MDKAAQKPLKKEQTLKYYETVEYDALANNWGNYDTGELITGFVPDGRLEYLLRNRIDKNIT